MCLNPIQIINPSKYISLKYRDPFLLHVPCGKCAECQQTNSNQWYLRTWQECLDANSAGAFCYFDTLTYNNDSLPMMSDILSDLPRVPCFRPDHIRNFVESLRIDLKRKYKVTFRQFISSEYGIDPRYTHRPHYHCLFFVYGNIHPLDFSKLVALHWNYGRTDGVPFKSNDYVLSHNTIDSSSIPADYLRACRYVTKYVQKSCAFDSEIEKRINIAMYVIAKKMPENWLESVNAQRMRMKIKRHLSQFHRQSQHFGENLLQSLDLNEIFSTGAVIMPSSKGLKVPVPLPMYYKRKLFYDLVVVDGTRTWQLNQLGIEYRNARRSKLMRDLSDRFEAASVTYNLGISKADCHKLSDYVYNSQGRINAAIPSDNLQQKLDSVTLFNYVTLSDKEHLSHRGIINRFIGNNTIGYTEDYLPGSYRYAQFIEKYVIQDKYCESLLSRIYHHISKLNDSRQSAFAITQRLESLYKSIRMAQLTLL